MILRLYDLLSYLHTQALKRTVKWGKVESSKMTYFLHFGDFTHMSSRLIAASSMLEFRASTRLRT